MERKLPLCLAILSMYDVKFFTRAVHNWFPLLYNKVTILNLL